MNASLVGEALDTLFVVCRALLVMIAVLAAGVTAAGVAVVAVVWWVCRAVRRACRGAWWGRVAPQGVPDGSRVPEPAPVPSQKRTRPSAPTWARTDKETA